VRISPTIEPIAALNANTRPAPFHADNWLLRTAQDERVVRCPLVVGPPDDDADDSSPAAIESFISW
jgi:hypothetical protein